MPREILETYEVEAENILFTGRSAFKVTEVREPSHPAFPGLVFEGHYFDIKRGVWGPKANLNAQYGHVWYLSLLTYPDTHFTAYLKPGDLAIVDDESNGAWVWSREVKCKVMDFGEKTSLVKITGKATQFVTGLVYEIPSQRLYRRKAGK